MISVKFSLRDKHAKQKSTIRTSVTFNGNRIVFCPGYSICPDKWDNKIGAPKKIKGCIEIKNITIKLKELDLLLTRLYDDLSIKETQEVSPIVLKQKILSSIHPKEFTEENSTGTTMVELIEIFIRDCESGKRLKKGRIKLEPATIQTYKTTLGHFKSFQSKYKRKLLVSGFNQKMHDDFLEYLELEVEEFSKNSASKNISNLRQVILYAIKLKLLPSSIMIDVVFETGREESDNIYLNEHEIQLLWNLTDFKNKGEQEVRDLFVLGCYTGLRFSNYSTIDLSYLKDNIYTTYQIKTKDKISIPIHPNVQRIIDKYNGNLPVSPTNQEFNRTLKDLGQRIPEFNVPFEKLITRGREKIIEVKQKWEMIQSHSARRSFCTNMYIMGVPIPTIMAISGHRSEKNFKKYIKASGVEHAQIMKSFWDKKLSENE